ncbi:hypothetical protein A447_03960 [Fusobacterium vincentii ATCC 51190]|jgi:putative uncharacterized protein FNV1996|uniref:Uncharacterized protein n=1 Tax=Fusobacterium vincentii TaxID=155615 RepID=A0AAJ1CSN7_FUSVC|nr:MULTISPECIES: hypothetical protein [Fusobacterium]ETT19157.1 hypothetical protein HMPREF1497_0780 [Fusobacterium sp. CM21]MDH2315308.1 hypothetical protein [Fusobacterium nucleatum]EJG09432.1 hypothetical protein A447_03960 [Fusobacterium vincentii ATCC 51190]ERT45733.1 hypothetical protein HMPREF1768_01161 [Fusobacterium nucleatum CTI-7]MCW0263454.1 hypothetical protein [Fusobacterium vincentii]
MNSNENIFSEENDDLKVEYEIINIEHSQDEEIKKYVKAKIKNIDSAIDINDSKLQEYNKQLKKFTNQADALDYTVAIGSGILAGIIDSFFVGDFSLSDGKKWGNEQLEKIVKKLGKNDNVYEAKKNLEKFHIPSDTSKVWNKKNITPHTHRIDDLAHHTSLVGLISSITTQFTEISYFQNRFGENLCLDITDKGLIGNNLSEKIFAGTVNWFYHLVSDMTKSEGNIGYGMGIPGPILSLAKELSMLPGINKTKLPQIIDYFYVKGFDLRTELGVLQQLGKQAIPVILNEVLIRVFYFFSRLIKEYKEKENFKDIDWKNVLPYKNRTLTRMLTISSGTFLAFDLLDAGIRSGGNWGTFVLRVNFVNIGRFTVSCYNEYKMEREKEKIKKDILDLYSQQLSLNNIKLSYNIAGMWVSTKEAIENIEEFSNNIQNSIPYIDNSNKELKEELDKIGDSIDIIKKENKNQKLLKNLKSILSE